MLLKIQLFFLFLFFSSSGLSQNFSRVDKHALKAPRKISKDLPKLTKYLVKDYQTDLEKVRSFYSWIAHNIKYDNTAYKKNRKRVNRSNADVLDRRQAVCLGYSTLFKEMCSIARIPCEVVDGYTKNQRSGVANLTAVNHAWNAVLIDGKWHLLDVTWGSGNAFERLEYYFLTPAIEMIYSHLPADPMWQLLDCPVKPGVFRKEKMFIGAHLNSTEYCFNYKDSIQAILKLSPIEKRLKSTWNSYHFNPMIENKKELGHIYMDYVSTLIDRAEELEMTDSIDRIKAVHLQIIEAGNEAKKYVELYDHQEENLAYSHLNFGIALSKEIEKYDDPKPILEEMRTHFEIARKMLEGLPQSFLIENALLQIGGYLEWVQQY